MHPSSGHCCAGRRPSETMFSQGLRTPHPDVMLFPVCRGRAVDSGRQQDHRVRAEGRLAGPVRPGHELVLRRDADPERRLLLRQRHPPRHHCFPCVIVSVAMRTYAHVVAVTRGYT